MASRSFLILHGLQGSGPGHWQTWLAARLRADGERVGYPDLPDPEMPNLASWRSSLENELAALPVPPIVICHSLSCLLWMHHTAAGGAQAERVLLVAPPSEGAGLAEIASFFPVPLTPPTVPTRLVCSDADPYCPEGGAVLYGEPLGVPADVLPGAGHVNPEAGYGAWPAVEAWCLDGEAPLAPAPA
jgi:predicted alpha/beta hydrolase family esterase